MRNKKKTKGDGIKKESTQHNRNSDGERAEEDCT